MNNTHKILLIGHNGFVGSLLKKEKLTNLNFILVSSSDLLDPLKENFVKKKIIEADLVILLSFINSNKLENLMYKNKDIINKVYDYIKKYNKRLFFISSDSADHSLTPYGKSKIECENILSRLNKFWYIRPGPIYHDNKNIFKGILNYILNSKKIIVPLPKKGNFNVKTLSIEKLLSIIEGIMNGKFNKGIIKIDPVLLSQFLKNKNKTLILLNIPKLIIVLIQYMPKAIKNRLPLDLIFNAYND